MAMSGDGLFSKARNAADKYKKAQEDEQELISNIGKEMYSEYVGAYIEGYEPTGGECIITGDQSGTGADQEFKTESETKGGNQLKWRIWDYDGTTLRIILDRPTTQKLELKGAVGYNNGVWAINEICRKCFGQYEEGRTMKEGISVANIRRSDIDEVSKIDYTKLTSEIVNLNGEKDNENGKKIHYGETRTYELNFKAPSIWSDYDSKWEYEYNENSNKNEEKGNFKKTWEMEFKNEDKSELGNTNEKTLFKESSYYYAYIGKMDKFKNEEYFNLLFVDGSDQSFFKWNYWVGSRYTQLRSDGCTFGCYAVHSSSYCGIIGAWLFKSDNTDELVYNYLRPIISINLKRTGYLLERKSDGSYLLK